MCTQWQLYWLSCFVLKIGGDLNLEKKIADASAYGLFLGCRGFTLRMTTATLISIYRIYHNNLGNLFLVSCELQLLDIDIPVS